VGSIAKTRTPSEFAYAAASARVIDSAPFTSLSVARMMDRARSVPGLSNPSAQAASPSPTKEAPLPLRVPTQCSGVSLVT
jgi:hypothetical protein